MARRGGNCTAHAHTDAFLYKPSRPQTVQVRDAADGSDVHRGAGEPHGAGCGGNGPGQRAEPIGKGQCHLLVGKKFVSFKRKQTLSHIDHINAQTNCDSIPCLLTLSRLLLSLNTKCIGRWRRRLSADAEPVPAVLKCQIPSSSIPRASQFSPSSSFRKELDRTERTGLSSKFKCLIS